jgi:hypothetical protein
LSLHLAPYTAATGSSSLCYQAIISLISAMTTSTGLKVDARPDENEYPTKIKVSDRAPRSAWSATASTAIGITP